MGVVMRSTRAALARDSLASLPSIAVAALHALLSSSLFYKQSILTPALALKQLLSASTRKVLLKQKSLFCFSF